MEFLIHLQVQELPHTLSLLPRLILKVKRLGHFLFSNESALPTIYIIGKLDSALAPSPIVGVGVFPLAVESSAIGVLRRQCFLLV